MFDRRKPDPAQGVFETLLVLDGHPVELDVHLDRLNASVAELYPDRDPPPLDVPVVDRPYGRSTTGTSHLSALRIAVAPDGEDGLGAVIERREAHNGDAISLHSFQLPGGLGAHKWVDRSLLDEARAGLSAGALPLIVDDGSVLEASRANVFVVRDGALLTPPTDGRILPGITRMRVLGIAAELGIESRQTAVARDTLLAADEVFLTGSVRGIERVSDLDGVDLDDRGEVTGRIAAALRRTWLDAEFG